MLNVSYRKKFKKIMKNVLSTRTCKKMALFTARKVSISRCKIGVFLPSMLETVICAIYSSTIDLFTITYHCPVPD